MKNIMAFVLVFLFTYIIAASIMVTTSADSAHYELICSVVHGVFLAVASIGGGFLIWKEW